MNRTPAVVALLTLAILTASCGEDPDPSATATPNPATTTSSSSAAPESPPVATQPPDATPAPAGTAQETTASGSGSGEAGLAVVAIQDGQSFSFPLSTCMTSATDPDSFLLPDSFQVYGQNESLELTIDWLSANGEDYFGTGAIEPAGDGEGGIVTFEPGDLASTDGAVAGETVVNRIGPDVEGITDGATATIEFSC